jgi:hypothetical protein
MSAAKLVQKIYGINKGKINRIITGSLKNNNFKLEN